MMPGQNRMMAGFGGVLAIDLGAIAENYRMLAERVAPAICGAAVKADAYGLGLARVAPALARAGCRHFFVAHPAEGAELRSVLGGDAMIYVLHGPLPGTERMFIADRLVPVLNSADQVAMWAALTDAPRPVLQIDTGMSRLGLSAAEWAAAAALRPRFVMSHLACADTPKHPANQAQLAAFRAGLDWWAGVPRSLAASSGIFLGPSFHFDLVRPGAALYGISPTPDENPMRPVVALHAAIVQTRDIAAGTGVGYGYSYAATAPMRVATVGVGYADGVPRSLSNRGHAYLGATRVPIIGRVSMDSIMLDVSALPQAPEPGTPVELIGPHMTLDAVATAAGTIGYEIMTGLGQRFARSYHG